VRDLLGLKNLSRVRFECRQAFFEGLRQREPDRADFSRQCFVFRDLYADGEVGAVNAPQTCLAAAAID
jgi:hypothetical protein